MVEEDEPVYVHARDPYTRVDILASSRHIRVELDGVTLAESRSPSVVGERAGSSQEDAGPFAVSSVR